MLPDPFTIPAHMCIFFSHAWVFESFHLYHVATKSLGLERSVIMRHLGPSVQTQHVPDINTLRKVARDSTLTDSKHIVRQHGYVEVEDERLHSL